MNNFITLKVFFKSFKPWWTLVHPSFNWTHWATLRCHPCLSRAATSAFSWTPSFVSLCWLCSSSSPLVDLVLSYILVAASTVLAVICTDCPYAEHVQASVIVFLSVCCPSFLVRFWFWPQRLLFCLSKRRPVSCSSAMCDVPHPVSLLMLLSMAIHQHRTGELTKLLLHIILSSLSG